MIVTVSGWVSGPNERGTLDIIWICVVTLFLSLWASWHEDIPQTPTPLSLRYSKKFKWVLLLLVAPELGLLTSLGQRLQAKKIARLLQSLGFTEWTQSHCMYALMGGIRTQWNRCEAYRTHGDHPVHSKAYISRCWCNNLRIRATDLSRLAALNLLPTTPPISTAEIDDSGKADVIVKAIALVQVLWLVIQCIARAVQKLAVSELEIVCLSYAFYCLLIYAGWWHKPLDATLLSTVYIEHTPDFDTYFKNKTEHTDITTKVTEGVSNSYAFLVRGGNLPSNTILLLWLFVHFGIFGGIHCTAWNNYFPTHIERWFWRASSLMLVCFIPLLYVYNKASNDDKGNGSGRLRSIIRFDLMKDLVSSLVIGGYVVARLYVVVESFAGLRKQPASMYQTVSWSNFIPHIG